MAPSGALSSDVTLSLTDTTVCLDENVVAAKRDSRTNVSIVKLRLVILCSGRAGIVFLMKGVISIHLTNLFSIGNHILLAYCDD